jgi:hypothetical protein
MLHSALNSSIPPCRLIFHEPDRFVHVKRVQPVRLAQDGNISSFEWLKRSAYSPYTRFDMSARRAVT